MSDISRRLFCSLAALLPGFIVDRFREKNIVSFPPRDLPKVLKEWTVVHEPAVKKPELPDPGDWMLKDPLFNAIWDAIKQWDIQTPGDSITGATGNHARAIFDSIYRKAIEFEDIPTGMYRCLETDPSGLVAVTQIMRRVRLVKSAEPMIHPPPWQPKEGQEYIEVERDPDDGKWVVVIEDHE